MLRCWIVNKKRVALRARGPIIWSVVSQGHEWVISVKTLDQDQASIGVLKPFRAEARGHGMTAISSHNLKYVVRILVGSSLHSLQGIEVIYIDDNEAVQGMFPTPETQLAAIGYAPCTNLWMY